MKNPTINMIAATIPTRTQAVILCFVMTLGGGISSDRANMVTGIFTSKGVERGNSLKLTLI